MVHILASNVEHTKFGGYIKYDDDVHVMYIKYASVKEGRIRVPKMRYFVYSIIGAFLVLNGLGNFLWE